MKLLVTGAGGFVGRRLVPAAQAAGHEVISLFRRRGSAPEPSEHGPSFFADLSDRAAVTAVLSSVRPNVILHTAARIPRHGSEDPTSFFDDNVRGTVHLLAAAREVCVDHIVFSSSMAVYGTPEYVPVDEAHPTAPDTVYGVSKLEGELYARLFARTGGPAVTVLRYSGVFGQGQRGGAIPTFITRCARDEPITLHAGGRPSSDYVWVEDVARANLLAVEAAGRSGSFSFYNIGSGVEVSVARLAHMIRDLAHSHSEIRVSEEASLRDFRFGYDVSRARVELGYTPVPLEEALSECVRTMAPRG